MFGFKRTNSPVRFTSYLILSLLASAASFSGCSSSSGEQSSWDIPVDGHGDSPRNAKISIDESTLQAVVKDKSLEVSFQVASVSGADVTGDLHVQLLPVNNKSVTQDQTVSYHAKPGKPQRVTATLPWPSTITRQQDEVVFNIRVTDGATDGLQVTRSLQWTLQPYNMTVEGPSEPNKGRPAIFRVRVENPRTHQVIPDFPVTLRVKPKGGTAQSLDTKTNKNGDAIFSVDPPDSGSLDVLATAFGEGTTATVNRSLTVRVPGPRVLLTTDKPIYQPGQTIHLRSLTLNRGNKPVEGADASFSVADGKGNKIFQKTGKTDAYGVAAATFRLGNVLNLGDFKVTVDVGGHKTEKTVRVAHYVLPKFKIGLTTDKRWYRPGQTLHGSVKSDYFFGKPVAGGKVTVEAFTLDIGKTPFQKIQGKTDAQGGFSFDLPLPTSLVGIPLERGNAVVTLQMTVTDTAGQQVVKEAIALVSDQGIDIALVPEATYVVPGIDNHLDLFLSDPMGGPLANTSATLSFDNGVKQTVTTDKWGHADVSWTPGESTKTSSQVKVATKSADGKNVHKTVNFNVQQGADHVVVRTDKSLYQTGDTIKVQVDTSDKDGAVYVDWINAGQTVDMRTLQADDKGVVSFEMPVDMTLAGSNRVEAYVVDGDGNVVRSGRTVFVRNGGSLSIDLKTDKAQYEPGESASFTFSVKDDQGAPTVAALGVQVVDEAVYGLVESKPGLLKTYFELEGMYSKPTYEVHGPNANLNDVLFSNAKDPQEQQANQDKARAAMAAMGRGTVDAFYKATWPAVQAASNVRLSPFYASERDRLVSQLSSAYAGARHQIERENDCTFEHYRCGQLPYTMVMQRLAESFKSFDFWGSAYKTTVDESAYDLLVRTSGPDETLGTKDDHVFSFTRWDLAPDNNDYQGAGGAATGAEPGATAGSGGGVSGGTAGAPPPDGNGEKRGEPRVRKDFPETLYVNPEIITGPDGKATISVPLADSITTWRVSSLANSVGGKLGGSVSGVTVFQDFFADINFPAELTRGDEVSFPIAVYNYLSTPQTVQISLEPDDWYTPTGATTLSIKLQPGEVKGARFPVRVQKVGVHTLTVKAIGSKKSDAVARNVRVVPDGRPFADAQSGAVGKTSKSHTVTMPDGTVPGSGQLYLNIFPAYAAQAVQGLDSMLRTPNGCFEQTTSTTWPNVLVMDYMKKSGQISPAIQMKAESLINAGYQRLLTFEHPNGGFSWFGTQDPQPYLSVTAFGLMEFSDMAAVHPLDDTLIPRTAQWLAWQQQQDGSWKGSQTEFFSFNTSTLRNTAFVAWSLATSGYTGPELSRGIKYVTSHLGDAKDDYTRGIIANALVMAAPGDSATSKVLGDLDGKKVVDNKQAHWDPGNTQGSFHGSGDDLSITTTALIAHALLKDGSYGATVTKAINYLIGHKNAKGTFGSTQATIWTLRTLLLAQSKGTDSAVGQLTVTLDGQPFATVDLTKDQSDIMQTVDMSSSFSTGPHDVGLSFVGTGQVGYNIVSKYNKPWTGQTGPASGPLSVILSYDKTNLTLDETALATVQVTNNTQTSQDMVLVTLGLPPGFQVMTEDFKPFLDNGSLSHYEVTGKQVILYITKIAAQQTQNFSYRVKATMPVKASDGGGSVFPYYHPKAKSLANPTEFIVTEK